MKFIVDGMLGKLAKWLKILGFDTRFESNVDDDRLLTLAEADDRVLLTRDTGLLARAGEVQHLFIESEDWRRQVRQVIGEFGLREAVRPFSRCLSCNAVLKTVSAKDARNLVSPFVVGQSDTFALCPLCGRIFWKGTHHGDMQARIEEILSGKDRTGNESAGNS